MPFYIRNRSLTVILLIFGIIVGCKSKTEDYLHLIIYHLVSVDVSEDEFKSTIYEVCASPWWVKKSNQFEHQRSGIILLYGCDKQNAWIEVKIPTINGVVPVASNAEYRRLIGKLKSYKLFSDFWAKTGFLEKVESEYGELTIK